MSARADSGGEAAERPVSSARLLMPLFWCEHRYPSGEYCPACGDIPDAYDGGMLVDEHAIDCECFACEEEDDGRP